MSKWTAQSYSDTMLKYLLCLSSAQSNSPLTRLWLGLIEFSIIAQRNSFLSGSSKSASFCACLQCRILSSNQQTCHLRCRSQREYCHLRCVTYCHLCRIMYCHLRGPFVMEVLSSRGSSVELLGSVLSFLGEALELTGLSTLLFLSVEEV